MTAQDGSSGTNHTNSTKEIAPDGSLPSFRTLYQGPRDSSQQWTWLDKEPENVAEAAENEDTAQHAIITRLQKANDSRKKYDIHSIIIQSPWLKKALSEILKDYPAVHCGLKRLEFQAPFRPFVHRWSQLLEFKARHDLDTTTAEHLQLLYDVLSTELEDVLKALDDYLNQGIVTFDHIWTIFQPGSIIYSDSHNGSHGAFKLVASAYAETRCGKVFLVSLRSIDWSGTQFCRSNSSIQLNEFSGTTRILGLAAFPLSFHPHQDKVKAALINRGKRFEELAGCHYKAYNGFAVTWDNEGREIPYMCNGRVIVDADGFQRFSPYHFHAGEPLTAKDSAADPNAVEKTLTDDISHGTSYVFGGNNKSRRICLTEEHHLICLPRVRGYSLKKKKWLLFYIDLLQDIAFNDNAFGALVLPEDQKELILTFAESQAMNSTGFDDVISGKGRGHITLLSGPPGVGKTLTAESVAEHMRAPLFTMSAGDLGINPDQVEAKITTILEMIAKWNAVLLLDECDVFLEARSTHDLERNKLVSIFLRVLEYYEGLLFLTTNRVDNIDAAFQSRIHVSLAYDDLTTEARRCIWENFLKGLGVLADWRGQDLDELAQVKLNGRQIKNVLKSAALLAARKKEVLGRGYVNMVLAIERRRPGVDRGVGE